MRRPAHSGFLTERVGPDDQLFRFESERSKVIVRPLPASTPPGTLSTRFDMRQRPRVVHAGKEPLEWIQVLPRLIFGPTR